MGAGRLPYPPKAQETFLTRCSLATCPEWVLGLCFLLWLSMTALPAWGQTKGDRAERDTCDRVLEKLFGMAEKGPLSGISYTCNAYMRHRMHTKRNGQLVRYMPGMMRLEKGTNDYLTEAEFSMQHWPKGEVDCKVKAFTSTARYLSPNRFLSQSRFSGQLYGTQLFDGGVLNPFHPRNRGFYRYRLLHHTRSKGVPQPTVRLSITPRWRNDRLAGGYADIDPQTGRITGCSLNFRYQLRNFTVTLRTDTTGYGRYLPATMRVVSAFQLLGNVVSETAEITTSYTYAADTTSAVPSTSAYDLTSQCLVRIDTSQTVRGSVAYFDSIRPAALRPAEAQLYAEAFPQTALTDALPTDMPPNAAVPSPGTIASPAAVYHPARQSVWEDKFLSSHTITWGRGRRATLKLPPVISPSMVEWGGSKGLTLKTKLTLSLKREATDRMPMLNFTPRLGYSFKQKQVYWQMPCQLACLPRWDGFFSLKAGGGSHIYNNRQAEALIDKLEGIEKYDSLVNIIQSYGFHDYRDTYMAADFSLSPRPGFRISPGVRYHRRSLIRWNEEAEKAQMLPRFTSIAPCLQLTITPGQYYYRDEKGRPYPLYSRWPTLLLSYERGYALGTGQTHYERIEADARYRINLYAMRNLFFRLGAGMFSHRGRDCFLDYDYFKFDYLSEGWTDELSGEFQLLGNRWYNESRYYARFTSTYESPMLLLSRFAPLTRWVQTERLYLNLLTVRRLPLYTELGYGVSSHLLNLGAFLSIAPDHSVGWGFRFVLRFFDE